jgi:alpha-L-rhamnosidase
MRSPLRSLLLGLALSTAALSAYAQTPPATWIWYPGDFEIWLSNEVQARRVERDAFAPPFWRMDSAWPSVIFTKQTNTAAPEELTVEAEGRYNVTIDGTYVQTGLPKVTLPAGQHTIAIQVLNQKGLPALRVEGRTVRTDGSWTVATFNRTPFNLPSAAAPIPAGRWNFNRSDTPPSAFRLPTEPKDPVKTERVGNATLVDFGQETFGYIRLRNLAGQGRVNLIYGESEDEARAPDKAETLDRFPVNARTAADFTTPASRAFRYVLVQPEGNVRFDGVSMLYESLPNPRRGAFRSSDETINRIWEVSARTLELNSREFYFDGIKRDRWVWSGDANQSYLMNYYLAFDQGTVQRTMWALRGKDPVEQHINTILDYSFYWFVSIYDYYLFTGDRELVQRLYPRMQSLMDFVLARRNRNGLVEGRPGDWVFIDWPPQEMPKDGELSAEQLLFARSLEAMALCARLVGDSRADEYRLLASSVRVQTMQQFWDPAQQALVHHRKDGRQVPLVTRYANMFAMLFGYLTPAQVESVKTGVILNDKIMKITTPYMNFYELEAMCQIGQFDYVTKQLREYWGGMLKEGATSFWEFYDPKETGAARYAMYGRPFGKSLAHAWGASPLYLLGRYYLGVRPTAPGYSEYEVVPNLGGLEWIEGKVPTPAGDMAVNVTTTQIKVTTVGGTGRLKFRSANTPSSPAGAITKTGDQMYELTLQPGREYVVNYQAVR